MAAATAADLKSSIVDAELDEIVQLASQFNGLPPDQHQQQHQQHDQQNNSNNNSTKGSPPSLAGGGGTQHTAPNTSEDDNMDYDEDSDDDDEDDSKSNHSNSAAGGNRRRRRSYLNHEKGDVKRSHHNVLERKRRDLIKDSFTKLREVVPTLSNERASRAQILKKAADFIQLTNHKNDATRSSIEELVRKNLELERTISTAASASSSAGQIKPKPDPL